MIEPHSSTCPPALKLDISGDRTIRNPQAPDVASALREAARRDDGYVILSRAEAEYMQTAAGIVEYRERGRHFRSIEDPVNWDVIEALFLAYLRGDPAWRGLAKWRDVTDELAQLRRGSSAWIFLVVLALLGVALAFWFLK